MENFSVKPPTYYRPAGLVEYMLIISPGEEVYNRVMEEKHFFHRKYNQEVAIKTVPQISISGFLAWEALEDSLIQLLQNIIKNHRSFDVTLNNYSGFPSHTIFIRVPDITPFNELTNRLKVIGPYIKTWSLAAAKFMNHPHLSIARGLPAEVYTEAIKHYSGKDFYASFNVTKLVLLRRKNEFDKCKEVAMLRLQPNEYNN
jgi:2'-5' RNA ligase superfamily